MAQIEDTSFESNGGTSIPNSPMKVTHNNPMAASQSKIQTPTRWKDVSDIVSALTPQAKEVAKLHSDMLKKVIYIWTYLIIHVL